VKTNIIWAIALFAGAVVPAVPCLFAGEPPATTHVVHIRSMAFNPKVVTIAPGDAITWINDDIVMHGAKSSDPKNPWQSKDLLAHASWTKRFERGGAYVCPYHPTMTGEIVVTAKGGGRAEDHDTAP